jgi:hypothetical protein
VLTVSLLAPNKINVLDSLARAGDGVAHERIVADLIPAMRRHYYSEIGGTDTARTLKIRLLDAPDAHEKLRSAYENLTSDARSRTDTLARKRDRLAAAQKEVAKLKGQIPGDEVKLAATKDRLAKAEARMKAAIPLRW